MKITGLKNIVGKIHKTNETSKTGYKSKNPDTISADKNHKKENDDKSAELELTEKEVDLIAKIVMAEAEGESFEGKIAVANVVLSRVNSELFPNTVEEVIYQPGQFIPIANNSFNKIKANEECLKATHEAIQGYWAVPDGTLFFLNENKVVALPKFLQGRELAKKIGNHSFYF
ncbi:cell wall hydrolase [Proteinivorax tanatarense]|uniref:Cell wall hydrolase n=1 Tax=Proteinivorax tanatarense TaxID=1260629 RepID=A0AAU7VL53_9FIRM